MPHGGNEVEEIAMFASGGVGPFSSGAGTMSRSVKPYIKTAPRRVCDIANDPIAALFTAV